MTTINYDKTIRDFIAGLNATGHVTHRSYKKKSVTFHHNGGRLSLQGILDVWKTRPASAHFQVDRAGAVGQYVKVNEYAWATGNTQGNIESISIEMADETLAPSWKVNPVTWRSAARLAGWLFANVIDGRPRPSKSNVFVHHHWKSTDCAGPYIDSIFNDLLEEVQTWYDHFRRGTTPPPPTTPPATLDELEAMMALYKTPAEFEAAMARSVEIGVGNYVARFLKDEAGTGDTLLDEVRAQRQLQNQNDANLLAATKDVAAAVRSKS